MRSYGDMSEEHAHLLNELIDLEGWFNQNGIEIDSAITAKGLTCMAHDYCYILFMEEEAERLLRLAEKYCPGYFKGPIYDQIQKHSEFKELVYNLKGTIALDYMKDLGFDK